MSSAWLQLPERGTTAALALINWIGLRLGRGAGRLLLYPISLYFLVTAAGPRRGSLLYLRRILGREPGWRDVFRHIHCFAATILDRAFLLAGRFDQFDIRVHGAEIIHEQVESGRGSILLSSHLGSFEVLRAVGVSRKRFPLKVLMNVDHNSGITRFMNALNPEIAQTIIPIQGPNTSLAVKERLDEGYMVGILADRVHGADRSTSCRFLGRQTEFPTGPMLLAAAAQCPVILAFGLYRGGNAYDVYFERLTDRIPREDRRSEEAMQKWTQRYVDRLEHHAREAPFNWFNFYDFWGEETRAK